MGSWKAGDDFKIKKNGNLKIDVREPNTYKKHSGEWRL